MDLSGAKLLASLIICQAVEDYKIVGQLTETPQKGKALEIFEIAEEMGFGTPNDEICTFFESERFVELCDVLGIDANLVRDVTLGKRAVEDGMLIGVGGKIFRIEK